MRKLLWWLAFKNGATQACLQHRKYKSVLDPRGHRSASSFKYIPIVPSATMGDLSNEKVNVHAVEDNASSQHAGVSHHEDAAVPHGPSEFIDGVPYWRTKLFLGSLNAIGFGALACYAGFAMPANTLALINEDIGMSHYPSDITLEHRN